MKHVDLRMIFSENRQPLFGITRQFDLRMIFFENRSPLFGIRRQPEPP